MGAQVFQFSIGGQCSRVRGFVESLPRGRGFGYTRDNLPSRARKQAGGEPRSQNVAPRVSKGTKLLSSLRLNREMQPRHAELLAETYPNFRIRFDRFGTITLS